MNAKRVSFYKGQTVVKSDLSFVNNRSGSFGIMILDKKTGSKEFGGTAEGINIVKHEYGHFLQFLKLNPIKYTALIAIPSATSNVSYEKYYSQLWERSADVLGCVQRENYSYADGSVRDSLIYLFVN